MTTYTEATTIPICGHTFCGKCLFTHFLKVAEIEDRYFTCPECQLDVDWTNEEVMEWIKSFQASDNDVVSVGVGIAQSAEDEDQNETIVVNIERNFNNMDPKRSSNRREVGNCDSNGNEVDNLSLKSKDGDNTQDQDENINYDAEATAMHQSTHDTSEERGIDDIHISIIHQSGNAEKLLDNNDEEEADLNHEQLPQTNRRGEKKSESSYNVVEEKLGIEGNKSANKNKGAQNACKSIFYDQPTSCDHEEAKQNTEDHEEEMDTQDHEQSKNYGGRTAIQDTNICEEAMDSQENEPDKDNSLDQRKCIQLTLAKEGTENNKTQIEANNEGSVVHCRNNAESGVDHDTLLQSSTESGKRIETVTRRVGDDMNVHGSEFSRETEEVDKNGNQANTFGTSIGEVQENQNEEVNRMTEDNSSESGSSHSFPYEFRKVKDFRITLSRKCSPTFTGLTLFHENTLLLCDNCGHNDTCGYLCLFNLKNNCTTKIEMDKPFSVCALMNPESMAAVSVPNNKMIYLVSACDDWLKVEKTFETKREPLSLIGLRDGRIGITWKCPPSFEIVDISGEDMTQVRYYTGDSSGRRFKSFRYVAVDENRSHIIQPCHVDNAVYCFHFSGDPVFTYTDTRLKGPYGVDTDLNGYIYICSRLNDTIHILSPTGSQLKIIFEDIPSCPQTIRFDTSGSHVWMTAFDRYDIVSLYTIEKEARSSECIAI